MGRVLERGEEDDETSIMKGATKYADRLATFLEGLILKLCLTYLLFYFFPFFFVFLFLYVRDDPRRCPHDFNDQPFL